MPFVGSRCTWTVRDGGSPHIEVWRSVRVGGDTKTPRSHPTLGVSYNVRTVLTQHRADDEQAPQATRGLRWQDHGPEYSRLRSEPSKMHQHTEGIPRRARPGPGIIPSEGTPRELRHSFVSILWERGLPIGGYRGLWVTAGQRLPSWSIGTSCGQSCRSVMDAVFSSLTVEDEVIRQVATQPQKTESGSRTIGPS